MIIYLYFKCVVLLIDQFSPSHTHIFFAYVFVYYLFHAIWYADCFFYHNSREKCKCREIEKIYKNK